MTSLLDNDLYDLKPLETPFQVNYICLFNQLAIVSSKVTKEDVDNSQPDTLLLDLTLNATLKEIQEPPDLKLRFTGTKEDVMLVIPGYKLQEIEGMFLRIMISPY